MINQKAKWEQLKGNWAFEHPEATSEEEKTLQEATNEDENIMNERDAIEDQYIKVNQEC